MHQPAWSLFDAIKLAGIEPDAQGYTITPHLPMPRFSMRLPDVGVEQTPQLLRGYIRPAATGTMRMRVALPAGARQQRVAAYAAGESVPFEVRGGTVVFKLPAKTGRAADWAVVAR